MPAKAPSSPSTRAQVVIIAHAAKDHACALDGFAGLHSEWWPGEFLGPGLGLGSRAVVDRDLMACRKPDARPMGGTPWPRPRRPQSGSASSAAGGEGDGGCS